MDIWSILRPIGKLHGNLVYYVGIWYIFPVLVFCSKKNLAILDRMKAKCENGPFCVFGIEIQELEGSCIYAGTTIK
jgi:hypothetical protein